MARLSAIRQSRHSFMLTNYRLSIVNQRFIKTSIIHQQINVHINE